MENEYPVSVKEKTSVELPPHIKGPGFTPLPGPSCCPEHDDFAQTGLIGENRRALRSVFNVMI